MMMQKHFAKPADYAGSNPARGSKQFIVARRSVNSNAFGLTKHFIMSRDGECFSFLRSRGDWHTEMAEGYQMALVTDSEGRVVAPPLGVECWTRELTATPEIAAQVFLHYLPR